MRWPIVGRRERLRREAAEWFAKLRGPGADAAGPAFERWYRSDAEHAQAYDRVASRYEAAGLLRQSEIGRGRALGDVRTQWRAGSYAFAAVLLCVAVMIGYLVVEARSVPGDGSRLQIATLSAKSGEPRNLILTDGSKVLLAPGSAVEVALGRVERRLRLVRGVGTFWVAHEGRPFIVSAGSAEVVAHGTQFVVSLAGSRATVSLIEGSVIVTYPAPGKAAGERRSARLQPGERLTVAPPSTPEGPRPTAGRAGGPAPVMLEFDDTPLSDAVARANAQGIPKLRLADPALGKLRVTGGFRAGDNRSLAAGLAAAFSLRLENEADAIVLRKPAPEGGQAP